MRYHIKNPPSFTSLVCLLLFSIIFSSSCRKETKLTDDIFGASQYNDDDEYDLPSPRTLSDEAITDLTEGDATATKGSQADGRSKDWASWFESLNGGAAGGAESSDTGSSSGGGDFAGEGANCIDGSQFICDVEAAIVRLCNEHRVAGGVSAFSHNLEVSYVSRDWSRQQNATGGISHAGFPTQRVAVFRKRFPDQRVPSMSGENVAKGMALSKTDPEALASSLVNMWMKSPGHRGNIMGRWSAIGVGVECGGISCTGTQIFIR